MAKKRISGITLRWAAVNLTAVALILVVAATAVMSVTKSNYYARAQTAIDHRLETLLESLPESTASNIERITALSSAVESFGERDKFELMLINGSGEVISTSSGFSYDSQADPLEDYAAASASVDGRGAFNGTTSRGEHVIAVTQLLMRPVGDIEAVRLVTSLTGVDGELSLTKRVVIAVCAVIFLFSVFSGLFFIRSIVMPVNEINSAARRITKGDYQARIDNRYRDEMGDLCDTINEMAAGLSEADRLKSEFISSVSHELRTPLTSIKGWAETLRVIGAGDAETFDKGMDIIVSESGRLSVLVEDLLDFSRLQTGRITVNRLRLDVTDELRGALSVFEQRVNRMGLALREQINCDDPYIMGDKNRLRQVFTNLVDNAIKYSRAGGEIRVEAYNEGGFVVIRVIDGGAGIPKEEIGRITQKFYKAKNSTTGSGIGLAVAREIIELHAGTLSYQSELGAGTTAEVRFPNAGKQPE